MLHPYRQRVSKDMKMKMICAKYTGTKMAFVFLDNVHSMINQMVFDSWFSKHPG